MNYKKTIKIKIKFEYVRDFLILYCMSYSEFKKHLALFFAMKMYIG